MTPLTFAADHFHKRPECRVKVIEFCRAFHRALPDDRTRRTWPRWKILSELRQQFTVGVDGDGVCYVAGLSFAPQKIWQADLSGRLILV